MGKFKLEQLLEFMVKNNASDIYLTFDSPPVYRIEGITKPAGDYKLTMEDCDDLAKQAMNKKQQQEFEEQVKRLDCARIIGIVQRVLGQMRTSERLGGKS